MKRVFCSLVQSLHVLGHPQTFVWARLDRILAIMLPLPFAIPTSICRSKVTICSGLYLFIGVSSSPKK
jgi:hypothetical protein